MKPDLEALTLRNGGAEVEARRQPVAGARAAVAAPSQVDVLRGAPPAGAAVLACRSLATRPALRRIPSGAMSLVVPCGLMTVGDNAGWRGPAPSPRFRRSRRKASKCYAVEVSGAVDRHPTRRNGGRGFRRPRRRRIHDGLPAYKMMEVI